MCAAGCSYVIVLEFCMVSLLDLFSGCLVYAARPAPSLQAHLSHLLFLAHLPFLATWVMQETTGILCGENNPSDSPVS
jgi:hypothetical protein